MKVTRVSTIVASDKAAGKGQAAKRLEMERYVPYQLALLSGRLSLALQQVCKQKYDISRVEWRILALVGQVDFCSASNLVERSIMDAVAVHRAVKRLEALGYIQRTESQRDMRVRTLSLTREGRKVYETIIPYAVALEEQLLSGLPSALAEQFKEALRLLVEHEIDLGLTE